MSCPLIILSQSDSLIQIVDIDSDTKWQTVQIQKPIDLDLHCLQKQGISRPSRIRVNLPMVDCSYVNIMRASSTISVMY